jgi:hypothetical protein
LTFFLAEVSNVGAFGVGRREKMGRFVAMGCAMEACRAGELLTGPPKAEVPKVLPSMELPRGCVVDDDAPTAGADGRPKMLVPPPKAVFAG